MPSEHILIRVRNFLKWLMVLVVVAVPIGYLFHLYRNYENIQTYLARKSAKKISAKVDDGDSLDLGYIYDMRRDTHIREGTFNLVWFVVIPATNVHYSCSYDEGYPEFKTGDSVKLIHTKSTEDGDYGYIVGIHNEEQGKVTEVWNFDLDSAMLDEPLEDQ